MSMNAGYSAFRMAYSKASFEDRAPIVQIDIPYTKEPAHSLWVRGWKRAEKEFSRGLPFRHNPFPDNDGYDKSSEARRLRQQASQKANNNFRNKHKKHFKSQHTGTYTPTGNVNVGRLENKFNKYRTTV